MKTQLLIFKIALLAIALFFTWAVCANYIAVNNTPAVKIMVALIFYLVEYCMLVFVNWIVSVIDDEK